MLLNFIDAEYTQCSASVVSNNRNRMSKQNLTSGRSSGRVTLADVAKKAGASPSTVSRALQKPEQVTEKLRLRVAQAVRELGYIPNQAARSLASAESKIISVIFPSLSNAVFSSLLDGIHDTLIPAGYKILLANSHYSVTEEEILIETMLEQNPDGIIITGVDQSKNAKQRLKNTQLPVVQVMDLCDEPLDMVVGFSHFDAGNSITEHLFSRGYKNIGFIGARMDKRSQRRFQGYRHALLDHGKDPDKYVLTSLSNSSFQLGADLMNQLIARHSDIDALFFSNDDLAAGAIFECQRSGVQVPRQLGIAGFNDLDFASAITPSLTTVSIPRYQMGKQAAQCMLDRLQRQEYGQRIDVAFSIAARESTR